MKLSKMAMIAAIACGIHAGTAFGQQANNQIQQVSCADCDCGQPACDAKHLQAAMIRHATVVARAAIAVASEWWPTVVDARYVGMW